MQETLMICPFKTSYSLNPPNLLIYAVFVQYSLQVTEPGLVCTSRLTHLFLYDTKL